MSDILFEMTAIGNSVKVTAIEAATGLEAVVIVPTSTSKEQMKKMAMNKLLYMKKKKG